MQFSKNFPDQLRSQIVTSDVVGKRVALKKKGKEYSGLCPFHNEKTPSFTVNDQKEFYHCFGCGEHGDIMGFIIKTEGINFKEAVIKLANDYNIPIPIIANSEQEQKQQESNKQDYLLLKTSSQFFANNLFSSNNNQALEYLYKRGLNNSHIKKFHLGFALNSYESLLNHLKSQGFSHSEILNSGIISKNNSGKIYDKFRNRIIFPITNSKGQIIAFGGRILDEDQPKYLNSSETNLFKKGHNLYNFYNAKKTTYEQKFAIIVEGYMDVISLSSKGIENIVAPLGTAITNYQLQMLFRITNDIVICLDGDQAGINAMRRTIDLALPIINSKNLIRFALLPKGVDPDDFIKQNGKMAMENILKNAPNLSQVLFDFEANDLEIKIQNDQQITPEKKAQLEAKLYQKINLITDPNYKKYFLQYYKNLLYQLGRNKKFQTQKPITITKSIIQNNFDKQDSYSIAIIAILANFPQFKDYQDEFCFVRNLEFKNQDLSNIKEQLIEFLDQNPNSNFSNNKAKLEELVTNDAIKNKIFSHKLFKQSTTKVQQQLQIFLLQYFYEEVKEQYKKILITNIETEQTTIKAGKQKELFNYKTTLEKKILQLTSEFND